VRFSLVDIGLAAASLAAVWPRNYFRFVSVRAHDQCSATAEPWRCGFGTPKAPAGLSMVKPITCPGGNDRLASCPTRGGAWRGCIRRSRPGPLLAARQNPGFSLATNAFPPAPARARRGRSGHRGTVGRQWDRAMTVRRACASRWRPDSDIAVTTPDRHIGWASSTGPPARFVAVCFFLPQTGRQAGERWSLQAGRSDMAGEAEIAKERVAQPEISFASFTPSTLSSNVSGRRDTAPAPNRAFVATGEPRTPSRRANPVQPRCERSNRRPPRCKLATQEKSPSS